MQQIKKKVPLFNSKLLGLFFLILIAWSCANTQQNNEQKSTSAPKGSYQDNIKGIVEIRTYDHYNREEKRGYGFFVERDIVITNLEWLKGAYKAKITPPGIKDFTRVRGYVAYDHNLNLVALKVQRKNPNYLKTEGTDSQPDSLYTLHRKSRNLFIQKGRAQNYIDLDSVGFWPVPSDLIPGRPAFRFNHQLSGIVQERQIDGENKHVVLSKEWFGKILENQKKRPRSIYDLRTKTDKVYISHKEVSGFRIKTTMGDITIKLYDETPEFRDNFIKLVSDQFYDSLLVHRVLKDFLIQTGAADSKYADKDDVVGWQGPGYNLETDIQPKLFHKRGAVAASKLPSDRNPGNKSDGSQFFIISGRVFTNEELDDIEEEKGFRFTPTQREV